MSNDPQNKQIIKTRNDRKLIEFYYDSSKPEKEACSADAQDCPWAKNGVFGVDTLRNRIEPWLTALVQSEHLSLLIGSGLTNAVYKLATDEGLPGMGLHQFATMGAKIEQAASESAKKAGRGTPNFEDQIRVVSELIRGLEILGDKDTDIEGLKKGKDKAIKEFTKSILDSEHDVLTSAENSDKEKEKRKDALDCLVGFLMSFASRTGTRERLHIFTTNYDRFIEKGADKAGLHLIDRFVGTLSPIFRSSRLAIDMHYNPPGIRGEPRYLEGVARFTKLHGSLDWCYTDGEIRRFGLPFGEDNTDAYLNGVANTLMVYPNSAKDRETAEYPYVELFRDFAAALCRPNSTLFCYGYGFKDEHINRVIKDMLTIPSTHLVIISHNTDDTEKFFKFLGRAAQTTVLSGYHLGNLETLVGHYLPKPAIDHITSRMAELTKKRQDAGGENGNLNGKSDKGSPESVADTPGGADEPDNQHNEDMENNDDDIPF